MSNRVATIIILALMAVPVAVYAADQKPAAVQSAPNVEKFDEQLAQAQKNMQKMQEQMAEIQNTQDPQKRQQLLQDHWTSMQAVMTSMHNMWGPGMMGCCAGGPMAGHMGMMGGSGMMGCCAGGPKTGHMGMMGGPMMGWHNGMSNYYSKLTPEQLKQRQYMMDQYMGMQQMMMDNMMMHQKWTTNPNRP